MRLLRRGSDRMYTEVGSIIGAGGWEVMSVPDGLAVTNFLAALRLWRWQRQMEGKAIGDAPAWSATRSCMAGGPRTP